MVVNLPSRFILIVATLFPTTKCINLAKDLTVSSNVTVDNDYVGYVRDPDGRGTASLIISCLLTLVLCVWSALHLNVPQDSATAFQNLFKNIRWIITGVYAPELVVFTAWRQWCSAKILGGLITSQGYRITEKSTGELKIKYNLRNPWTMTHSFFASTGGFVFDYWEEDQWNFLPRGTPHRLSITARGMALLIKCGHVPDIPEAEIKDKSKANNVAKALVMIQAFWMLIQVLARVVTGLPVTLLEINTIAHVMCAFFMYMMWWHKPLAPNEPHIMKGDWVKPLCAYMFMCSSISGDIDPQSMESQTRVKTLFAYLHLYSKVPEIESLAFLPGEKRVIINDDAAHSLDSVPTDRDTGRTSPESGRSFSVEDTNVSDGSDLALRPASKVCLDQLRAKNLTKASGTAFFERRPRVKGVQISIATASASTIKRWNLAALAIKTCPAIREHYLYHSHLQNECLHFKPAEFLVQRVHNWPSDDLLRNVGGLVVGMILWLACFAYGGIHLTAWNDHFPSEAEKWLWRSSSIYIGFCGGLWIVLNYVAQAYGRLNTFWERWMDGGGRWWQNIFIGVPVFLCGLSLVLARAFIVVEAFISIRELPAAAYDTPSWTQVLPHF